MNRVYVVSEQSYIRSWGVWHEDDSGKASIAIEEVQNLREGHSRLPAEFANRLYDAGESGMGYRIFTVVFDDGSHQVCLTGNAVDFVEYPSGKAPENVTAVLHHTGREDPNLQTGPDYLWCLYDGDPSD